MRRPVTGTSASIGELEGVPLDIVGRHGRQGRRVTLAGPNADDAVDRLNEDLAVAHGAAPRGAQECVDVNKGAGGRITFTNTCDEKIFIVWCGDLKYSKQRCGNGPKGGFYTHSNNFAPGQSHDAVFDGRFSYGACKGGISFGNDGEYIDNPSGGIQCLKR